jgi:hypothetical protein
LFLLEILDNVEACQNIPVIGLQTEKDNDGKEAANRMFWKSGRWDLSFIINIRKFRQ